MHVMWSFLGYFGFKKDMYVKRHKVCQQDGSVGKGMYYKA